MFIILQAQDYHRHTQLMDGMFKLRKKVFADQLQWSVETNGNWERDAYDNLSPVYIIWVKSRKVLGAIRLLPTTGPTLLHDVFVNTFPNTASLSAPGIWEATRCCVDIDVVKFHHPEMSHTHAFGMMCLAAAELSLRHGIDTLVSNYEPQMRRIYEQIGAEISELGLAHGFGRRPVCCGFFAISPALIGQMREALGVHSPLPWTTAEGMTERANAAA